MELTIISSTNSTMRPIHYRRNLVRAEKQLKPMVYHLTQEIVRWPFLTSRLASVTDITKKLEPPLLKQAREFMQNQLEQAEKKGLTLGTFVSLANDPTFTGFWRDHASGNLRTRKAYKSLGFLNPCWGKKNIGGMFSAAKTLVDSCIQDLLSMSINLLLALYLLFQYLDT